MNEHLSIYSLAGQTALITGGGSGLGLGMATCLASAGANVVLVGRRATVLEQAKEAIGENAYSICQDITQTDEADGLVRKAEELTGSDVDILINNAGTHCKKTVVDTTIEDFQTILETHVLAAHALTRAVLPKMIQNGKGSVIFIASMVSFMGVPQVSAYSAAKSAYLGMVRTTAAEVSAHGVRVNGIAPGWIQSDMLEKAFAGDPARKQKVLSRTPMNSLGQPQDIGWMAAFLCSEAAKFVTGTVIPVDGGASIGF